MSNGVQTVRIHPELKARVPWIDVPLITAPSPRDRDELFKFKASEEFIIRNFHIKRRVPIFQAWVHLVGDLPPISNIGRLYRDGYHQGYETIRGATACFSGIRRPWLSEIGGESIMVYVVKSPSTLTYQPDIACVAKMAPCPNETVFVAYVSPFGNLINLQDSSNRVDGVIIRWEFVPSDQNDPNLPKDYETRYSKRLW